VLQHQLVRLPLLAQPGHGALPRAGRRCVRGARQPPAQPDQLLGRALVHARAQRLQLRAAALQRALAVCRSATAAGAAAAGALARCSSGAQVSGVPTEPAASGAMACGADAARGAAASGALAKDGAGGAAGTAEMCWSLPPALQRRYARCGARYTCLKEPAHQARAAESRKTNLTTCSAPRSVNAPQLHASTQELLNDT